MFEIKDYKKNLLISIISSNILKKFILLDDWDQKHLFTDNRDQKCYYWREKISIPPLSTYNYPAYSLMHP